MFPPTERESEALDSLHDISQYTSYIDRKILRLGELYQSLDMTKQKPKRQLPQKSSGMENKFYSTAKEPFNDSYGQVKSHLQAFYTTQYKPKPHRKLRYGKAIINGRTLSDFKSEYQSLNRTRSPFSTIKPRQKPKTKQCNQEKLSFYQDVKKEMLNTFYIGTKNFEPPSRKAMYLRHSEQTESSRGKKGRLWHGRPPVKIIEKDD